MRYYVPTLLDAISSTSVIHLGPESDSQIDNVIASKLLDIMGAKPQDLLWNMLLDHLLARLAFRSEDKRDAEDKARDVYYDRMRVTDSVKKTVQISFSAALANCKTARQGNDTTWLIVATKMLDVLWASLIPNLRDQAGANPSYWNGNNALHLAAASYCPQVVDKIIRLLRDHNPDCDDSQVRHGLLWVPTMDDQFVLMLAIKNLDVETVRILVREEPLLLKQCWRKANVYPLHDLVLALQDLSKAAPQLETDAVEVMKTIANADPSSLLQKCNPITAHGYTFNGGTPYMLCEGFIRHSASREPGPGVLAIGSELLKEMKHLIFRRLTSSDIPKALHEDRAT
ncbi:hypothetical protein N656DRAFT_168900 [Canariomyces notabilis]|uniref:Ankyrin repeat protein n=1 Tax=Canariomyces notabilis TaxID=2074819 RepID=A0AAN6TAN6_9PEZI|nr:hypothetical protein N656DRAFT_168900 [Canariomyces arenarius]